MNILKPDYTESNHGRNGYPTVAVDAAPKSGWELVTTDWKWRISIGKISCIVRLPILAFGAALQTLKIVAKIEIAPILALFGYEIDTNTDEKNLFKLFSEILTALVGVFYIAPKDYCSLSEAFVSTAKIVILGEKNEEPVVSQAAAREVTTSVEENKIPQWAGPAISLCINQLSSSGAVNDDGLFRKSGQKHIIDPIVVQIKIGNENEELADLLADRDVTVHDVVGVLKAVLQDKAMPPLLAPVQNALLSIDCTSDGVFDRLKEVIDLLPIENRNILAKLIGYLGEVVDNAAINRMTVSNLAITFMPNLVKVPEDIERDMIQIASFLANANNIFVQMITHRAQLFPIAATAVKSASGDSFEKNVVCSGE